MMADGCVDIYLHEFSTFALYWSKYSATRSSLNLVTKYTSTHLTGGWVVSNSQSERFTPGIELQFLNHSVRGLVTLPADQFYLLSLILICDLMLIVYCNFIQVYFTYLNLRFKSSKSCNIFRPTLETIRQCSLVCWWSNETKDVTRFITLKFDPFNGWNKVE
jgi:hypothetical protein